MKTLLYSLLQKQPYFFSSVLYVPPWHGFKLNGVLYLSIFFQDKPYGFPNNSLQGEKQHKFFSIHMFGNNNNGGITCCYFSFCSVKGMCFSAVTQIMRFFPCYSVKSLELVNQESIGWAGALWTNSTIPDTISLSSLIARKSPRADGIAEYFDLKT